MNQPLPPKITEHDIAGWRKARLAAVQALYQMDMVESTPAKIIEEFLAHRLEIGSDAELFSDIVGGVIVDQERIDQAVIDALTNWNIDRLETVLRAIMRAGVWELYHRPVAPARSVITEYVQIGQGFFTGREPAMINAVLDRVARLARPNEL